MDRETLVWSAVLSVPPGVGIVGFVTHVSGGVVGPVAVAAGVATTLVIFSVVAYASAVGSADESRDGTSRP